MLKKGVLMSKNLIQSIFYLFFFSLVPYNCSCSKDGVQDLLEQARQAREAGEDNKAKELYLKAAETGSAEAHFEVAYCCTLTPEEQIYHFSEAAKQGHEKALGYALDDLFFRADSLEHANPQRAFEIYQQAKKANPNIDVFGEEVLQMSVEPGPFDWQAFCTKYDVPPHSDDPYHVWKIAEEASRGGRFGNPDPKLILQLVSRGGVVPAELESAVKKAYKNWKKGTVKEFNIRNHVTSGLGAAFCSAREANQAKKEQDKRLSIIRQKLNDKLDKAYMSAVNFIESKAANEECNSGGTLSTAFRITSETEQKDEYISMIEKVCSGYKPSLKNSFADADRKLNETYKKLISNLKKRSETIKEDYDTGMPTVAGVRDDQRWWIEYRDATIELFRTINPDVPADIWKSWLTEIRELQLRKIPYE